MPTASGAYLLLYNVAQLIGWSYALWVTVVATLSPPTAQSVFDTSGPTVRLWQGVALLETFHAAAGIVRGSPVTAFVQWFGRSNVLFAILSCVPQVQQGWPVPALFIAWAIADIIRYAWYAAAQIKEPPAFLTWLRYTLFIALYPIGVTSEIMIIYHSLPVLKQSKLHSVELPNWFNFAFSYYYFNLFGLFVLYPTVFPWMFTTLLQQRRRRLSGNKQKQK